MSLTGDTSPACVYGAVASDTTLVLFGDSHAAQWFPALEQVAARRRWRLVSLTKSACPSAMVSVLNPSLGRAYVECDRWRRRAFARIDSLHATIVVVSNAGLYTLVSGSQQISMTKPEGVLMWTEGLGSSVRELARQCRTHGGIPGHAPTRVRCSRMSRASFS